MRQYCYLSFDEKETIRREMEDLRMSGLTLVLIKQRIEENHSVFIALDTVSRHLHIVGGFGVDHRKLRYCT